MKIVLTLAVSVFAVFLVTLDAGRRKAERSVVELSAKLAELQGNDPEHNAEVAKQILGHVRRHMVISVEEKPTVAQIVDAKKLREKNPFYSSAKDGDYLVLTATRAILYDPRKDLIVDVMPLSLTPKTPQ